VLAFTILVLKIWFLVLDLLVSISYNLKYRNDTVLYNFTFELYI